MAGAPNGTVVATWMHFNDGVSSSIQASIRRPNGTFSAPITLSDPSDYSTDPRVDVANDGTATIVYLANTSTELVAKAVAEANVVHLPVPGTRGEWSGFRLGEFTWRACRVR